MGRTSVYDDSYEVEHLHCMAACDEMGGGPHWS